MREELEAQLRGAREQTEETLRALKDQQKRLRKELTQGLRQELKDECGKVADRTLGAVGEVSTRLEDVNAAIGERLATLAETAISRQALGETLLALGAQLLGAAEEPISAPAANESTVEPEPEPATRSARGKSRTKKREKQA
jgi:hypothetical protein